MEKCRLRIVRFEPGPWEPNEALASQWTSWLDEECVKARARDFALRLTRLVESLPMTGAAGICGDELLQSATLIGTNCEAAFLDTLTDDLRQKLGVVNAEAQECRFWLDLLIDAEVVERSKLDELIEEVDELIAVVAETVRSARGNHDALVGSEDSEVPNLRLRR